MVTDRSGMNPGFVGQELEIGSGAQYVLEGIHDEGAHGVVFKARRSDRPDSIVAVKCRQPRGGIAASSFAREADLLTELAPHPNLIGCLGTTTNEIPGYGRGLVLEWASSSLHQQIGKMQWQEFLPILEQMLDVLAHLHSRGVIHRDICPENILLLRGEEGGWLPKLADFSIAVKLDGPMITADGRHFHKAGYSHPRIGALAPCQQIDLYALGASAFRVLTGAFVPGENSASSRAALAALMQSLYSRRHQEAIPEQLADLVAELLRNEELCAATARDRLRRMSIRESAEAAERHNVASPEAEAAHMELFPKPGGTAVIVAQMIGAARRAEKADCPRRHSWRPRAVLWASVLWLFGGIVWTGAETGWWANGLPLAIRSGSGPGQIPRQLTAETETVRTDTSKAAGNRFRPPFSEPDQSYVTGEGARLTIRRETTLHPETAAAATETAQVLRYDAPSGEKLIAVLSPETRVTTEEKSPTVLQVNVEGKLAQLAFEIPGLARVEGVDAPINLELRLPVSEHAGNAESISLKGTIEGRLAATRIEDSVRNAGINSLAMEGVLTFRGAGGLQIMLRDLSITIPQATLAAAIQRGMPASLPVSDHKLTDQFLFWRDLYFRKMELTNLVPAVDFDKADAITFVLQPTLTGQLEKLYEHIVVDFPVQTVATVDFPLVGRRDVKTSVPRKRSDWRADTPSPFRIRATVPGRIELTESGGETLTSMRIVLRLKTETAPIDDVRLEKFPVAQELAPVLKTNISGIKLPAIDHEIVLEPFAGQPALSRIRNVKLRSHKDGADLRFHGAAEIETSTDD